MAVRVCDSLHVFKFNPDVLMLQTFSCATAAHQRKARENKRPDHLHAAPTTAVTEKHGIDQGRLLVPNAPNRSC
jgi:hypothetical protein